MGQAQSVARFLWLSFFLLLPCMSGAAVRTAFLSWDDNPEPDITNYVVSLGTAPGSYWWTKNVSPANQLVLTNVLNETIARASIANLRETNTYYVAVRAQNAQGVLGDLSNEVVVFFKPPGPVTTGGRVILTTQIQSSTNAFDWHDIGRMEFVSGLLGTNTTIRTVTRTNFVARPSP